MSSRKQRHLRHNPQTNQEQQPMSSFETENQNSTQQNQQSQQAQQPSNEQRTQPTQADGNTRRVLVLRARQAALDVVLDNVSIIRAQARLMECVDKDDWSEVFAMVKEEVQHQRDELLQNATLEEALRMAEETGEDIEDFARRCGVSLEDIAAVFENARGTKVNLS